MVVVLVVGVRQSMPGVFVRGSRGTREECRFAPEEVWRRRTRDRGTERV